MTLPRDNQGNPITRDSLGNRIVFEVIDTHQGRLVISTYWTHRQAFNAARKIEPQPTRRPIHGTPHFFDEWRFLIRSRRIEA